MYCSTGYIHLKNIGPQHRISLTRWTTKCTIMSKNEGGKNIYIWQRTTATSSSKSSNCLGSITFAHIELKMKHTRLIATQTFSGNVPRIATSKSYCINTWQSCDFKPTNLSLVTDTRLLMFEEYPCGTFIVHKHSQKLLFSVVDIV